MSYLFLDGNRLLTELAGHVSLGAILLQMFVEEPLLKLGPAPPWARNRQVLTVLVMWLQNKC